MLIKSVIFDDASDALLQGAMIYLVLVVDSLLRKCDIFDERYINLLCVNLNYFETVLSFQQTV